MRTLMNLRDVDLIDEPAGHVLPGDWIETYGGVGAHAFDRVLSVRYHEDNRPHGRDIVEFTLDKPAGSWATTFEAGAERVLRVGRPRTA